MLIGGIIVGCWWWSHSHLPPASAPTRRSLPENTEAAASLAGPLARQDRGVIVDLVSMCPALADTKGLLIRHDAPANIDYLPDGACRLQSGTSTLNIEITDDRFLPLEVSIDELDDGNLVVSARTPAGDGEECWTLTCAADEAVRPTEAGSCVRVPLWLQPRVEVDLDVVYLDGSSVPGMTAILTTVLRSPLEDPGQNVAGDRRSTGLQILGPSASTHVPWSPDGLVEFCACLAPLPLHAWPPTTELAGWPRSVLLSELASYSRATGKNAPRCHGRVTLDAGTLLNILVIDAMTSMPVPDAVVQVSSTTAERDAMYIQSQTTDEDGRSTLVGRYPAEGIGLAVAHRMYESVCVDVRAERPVEQRTIPLSFAGEGIICRIEGPAELRDEVTLHVTKAIVWARDSIGRSVAAAEIGGESFRFPPTSEFWIPVPSTTTTLQLRPDVDRSGWIVVPSQVSLSADAAHTEGTLIDALHRPIVLELRPGRKVPIELSRNLRAENHAAVPAQSKQMLIGWMRPVRLLLRRPDQHDRVEFVTSTEADVENLPDGTIALRTRFDDLSLEAGPWEVTCEDWLQSWSSSSFIVDESGYGPIAVDVHSTATVMPIRDQTGSLIEEPVIIGAHPIRSRDFVRILEQTRSSSHRVAGATGEWTGVARNGLIVIPAIHASAELSAFGSRTGAMHVARSASEGLVLLPRESDIVVSVQGLSPETRSEIIIQHLDEGGDRDGLSWAVPMSGPTVSVAGLSDGKYHLNLRRTRIQVEAWGESHLVDLGPEVHFEWPAPTWPLLIDLVIQ